MVSMEDVEMFLFGFGWTIFTISIMYFFVVLPTSDQSFNDGKTYQQTLDAMPKYGTYWCEIVQPDLNESYQMRCNDVCDRNMTNVCSNLCKCPNSPLMLKQNSTIV